MSFNGNFVTVKWAALTNIALNYSKALLFEANGNKIHGEFFTPYWVDDTVQILCSLS